VRIGFIHNAFPVLSETFISKEMLGLAERGIDVRLYSLFKPAADRVNADYSEQEKIFYLIPGIKPLRLIFAHLFFMFRFPLQYWKTLFFACKQREARHSFFSVLVAFSLKKEMTKSQRPDMLLHFLLAVPLALKIRSDHVDLLNSHFADAAASFTLLVSRLLSVKFMITAHAYDIFTPQANLHLKITEAEAVLTCTHFNKTFFLEKYPMIKDDKIRVFYHGIDTERFSPQDKTSDIFTIFSVGRLVPKKGFPDLLKACAALKEKGIAFVCTIVGDGPLRSELESLVAELHLQNHVQLLGALPSSHMQEHYRQADVFALPCVVEDDGNRDGIPNVIAEAMAMQLPIVSTTVSGIPELVQHDKSGVLINEHDTEALTAALERLIKNADLRLKMGREGRDRVKTVFDSQVCLDKLATYYVDL